MKFDATIVQAHFPSPLGPVTVAATDRGLAGVWFDNQRHLPEFAAWPCAPTHPVLVEAIVQLMAYFAGTRVHFNLPLDLRSGTAFQQAVWQALLNIEPGTTTSYSALSASIGKPKAVRASGAAVGRNPIGIIVPCHRVLGRDGSLTGYAGGLDRKVALLKLEGVKLVMAISATPTAALKSARATTTAFTESLF